MSFKQYDHEKSLIHDILIVRGIGVRDILGYVSHEFGDPVFQITRIVLDTDEALDVEGEHDMPYITGDPDTMRLPDKEDEGDAP